MAKKEKTKTTEHTEKKEMKKPGGGAVVGSIFLFLLTCIFGILFLCSTILYTALPQKSLSAAVSKMDLSQMELTDDGKTQKLGQWLYDWYLWDAPNLSKEYAEVFIAQPEVNEMVCDYLDDLSNYLTKETDTLPELDVNNIADLMQDDLATRMQKKTGITFAEADRQSILWTMGDDVSDWNDDLYETVGSGFGKFAVRFLCTIPGMITFGGLTVGFFVLWLCLAIKGHWRKSRMLIGYGCATAIPSLLVLAGSGILLLLVNVFHAIHGLAFMADGLPTLLIPIILPSLSIALCGMIITSIGIFTNAIAKARSRKQAPSAAEPNDSLESAKPAAEDTPKTPEFVFTEAPKISVEPSASEPTATFCPHCGAQNDLGSKFCGSCGQAM